MPRSPVEIRPAELCDIGPVVYLGSLFHQESWHRDFNFAPDKLTALIERVLIDPNMAGWVAVTPDGLPVGYAAAIAAEMYFSRDRNVTDLGVYLMPEYRDFFIARELIRRLEAWAWAQPGVVCIDLGISSGVADARISRFYERLGYTKGFFGVSKKSR